MLRIHDIKFRKNVNWWVLRIEVGLDFTTEYKIKFPVENSLASLIVDHCDPYSVKESLSSRVPLPRGHWPTQLTFSALWPPLPPSSINVLLRPNRQVGNRFLGCKYKLTTIKTIQFTKPNIKTFLFCEY